MINVTKDISPTVNITSTEEAVTVGGSLNMTANRASDNAAASGDYHIIV